MRLPSIHVTEEDLIRELAVLGYSLSESDARSLSKALRKRQLKHRSLVLAPTAAQASKLSGQKVSDAETLRLYGLLSRVNGDRSMYAFRPVKPGQAGWSDVVTLVEAARRFTEAFEITDLEDGVLRYYQLAYQHLGSRVSVRNMAACYEDVVAKFRVEVEVLTDPYIETTRKIFEEYCRQARLSSKVAEGLMVKNIYVHFVRAAVMVTEIRCGPTAWVTQQFEAVEWTGKFPLPKDLHGEQALQRWASAKKGKTQPEGPKTVEKQRYEDLLKQRKT